VIGGTDVKIGELDAMGARLLPGPDLYTSLLQGLADSFAICSKG
jgi:zinc transport system substrate-binding protein